MPNVYRREYYESHKEQMKIARDKYRKGTPEALERTRKINRDRYNNLPPAKKELLLARAKEKRDAQEIAVIRIQYRINLRKRQIRQYEKGIEEQESNLFMLKMKDTWESADFRYADELNAKIRELKGKIDKKNQEIEDLTKEKESM